MGDATNPAPTLAQLLADGAWHSGPALAQTLGVTRATVSARARRLRTMGLDVFSVAGRGHRLSAPIELLDGARIRAALAGDAATRLDSLAVVEHIDSTNAELARRDRPGMHALFAEYQSAGRGRAQRVWASPFGANLYLSLACTLSAARAPLSALSLAVGARIAPELVALGADGIGLKWPNDLWADGEKLGGILIEHRGEIGGSARLIIGVGLNVAMAAPQATAIDQPWTRLIDHLPAPPPRNRLAACVLAAMIDAVGVFERDGNEGFQARWSEYDVTRDRTVRVLEAAGERCGVARGIAADGALQVEIGRRLETVYSGDVSLRVAP